MGRIVVFSNPHAYPSESSSVFLFCHWSATGLSSESTASVKRLHIGKPFVVICFVSVLVRRARALCEQVHEGSVGVPVAVGSFDAADPGTGRAAGLPAAVAATQSARAHRRATPRRRNDALS